MTEADLEEAKHAALEEHVKALKAAGDNLWKLVYDSKHFFDPDRVGYRYSYVEQWLALWIEAIKPPLPGAGEKGKLSMSDDRLVYSLAERLYAAHMEWRSMLSESNSICPRWFALAGELKAPYLAAARAMIQGEDRDRSLDP